MSSNAATTTCLRAMRRAARWELRSSGVTSPRRAHSIVRSFSTTPSRRIDGPPDTHPTKPGTPDASTMSKFAAAMRSQGTLLQTTEPYVAYGATQELFKICASAADYTMPPVAEGEEKLTTADGQELGIGSSFWYHELGLLCTFNTWAQVTMAHMYLLTARIRMFPADHARYWHQNLLDHFFYACEDKMATNHGMVARSVRNRYLKDLFVQWRGVLAAYDEGLIKGDAVMGAAVWRNIFGGKEDVDAVKVAQVVAWLRRGMQDMGNLRNDEIAGGAVVFPQLESVVAAVEAQSKGINEPFAVEPMAAKV